MFADRASGSRYFLLEREVLDAREAAHEFDCSTASASATTSASATSEDDCLLSCLARRFSREFGCLHARIRALPEQIWRNETDSEEGARACW